MQAFRTEINFAIKICGLVKNFYGLFLPLPRTANDVSPATIRLQIASDRTARRISSGYLNRERSQKPQGKGDKVNEREMKGEEERKQ